MIRYKDKCRKMSLTNYSALNDSEDYSFVAASYGYLDVLKYLHENDCPWDERTCYYASLNGHLDCLKYLHGAFGFK